MLLFNPSPCLRAQTVLVTRTSLSATSDPETIQSGSAHGVSFSES
jgi:hypothetical protein